MLLFFWLGRVVLFQDSTDSFSGGVCVQEGGVFMIENAQNWVSDQEFLHFVKGSLCFFIPFPRLVFFQQLIKRVQQTGAIFDELFVVVYFSKKASERF